MARRRQTACTSPTNEFVPATSKFRAPCIAKFPLRAARSRRVDRDPGRRVYVRSSPMAMDISPVPQSRQKPQQSVGETAPVFSPMRKRSNTVRAFGRELSNGGSPKTSTSTSFKEQMFQHATRSPLPGEWLKMEGRPQGVCFHFLLSCCDHLPAHSGQASHLMQWTLINP